MGDVSTSQPQSQFPGVTVQPTAPAPPSIRVGPRLELNPATYDPRGKDWATVVSACRTIGNLEKRMLNQIVRATFHDAMTVDPEACATGDCGAGADGSLFLDAEVNEDANKDFADRVRIVLFKVAGFCRVSVADVLAVCGAVGIEMLSGNRIKILGAGGVPNFPVGRVDSEVVNPVAVLPPSVDEAPTFSQFWTSRNFTMREAMSLMGSHSLDPRQGCWKGFGNTLRRCNPNRGFRGCQDVRMFLWDNHFYRDLLPSANSDITAVLSFGSEPDIAELARQGRTTELARLRAEEKCKWSSTKFRNDATKNFDTLVREANLPDDQKTIKQVIQTDLSTGVTWQTGDACPPKVAAPGDPLCADSSNNRRTWVYTFNDANMAQLLKTPEGGEEAWKALPTFDFVSNGNDTMVIEWLKDARQAIRDFAASQDQWDDQVIKAFIKMVSSFVRWSRPAGPGGFKITGLECNSLFTIDSWCAWKAGKLWDLDCSLCAPDGRNCDPCCRCSTSFVGGRARRFGAKK